MNDHSRYNWILVIASLLFTLLMLEVGLRLVVPLFSNQPDADAAIRHDYDPIRSHRLNPSFHTKNNTNGKKIHSPDGFRRDTTVELQKPQHTIRIIALGGSTLYGLGIFNREGYTNHRALFNDETITYFLQRQLNDYLADHGIGCNAQVINAGVVAYRTPQELIYLNSQLLDYAPDIVINVDGHNDFYADKPAEVAWNNFGYGTFNLLRTINNRDFIPALHTFFRWAAPYSMLANQLEKRVSLAIYNHKLEDYLEQDRDRLSAEPEVAYVDYARRTFLRNLWQINNLGKREDYDHMVFLQPEVLFEDPGLLSKRDRNKQETTKKFMPDGTAQDYQRKRKMLPELFQAEAIPFIDIGEIARFADGKTPLYIDYCHLTPAGSKIVAEQMFPHILPLVLKRAENCPEIPSPLNSFDGKNS